MTTDPVRSYINHRFDRWLDYAEFHSRQAKIPEDAGDILNEVLLSLLKKDHGYLQELLEKKKQGYTELDFFVLRMIKLNAHSMTSPWRHKNKDVPIDRNVDPWQLKIIDKGLEDEPDPHEITLRGFRKVREALAILDIPQLDKDLFTWVFLAGNSIRSFPSERSYPHNCTRYLEVIDLIMALVAPERFKIRRLARNLVFLRSRLKRVA